jgi:hypothetical protein
MKKISKGFAFVFGMVSILSMFLLVVIISIFKLTTTNELMVAAFLTALVGMVTSYMGIDVVNNGVRGKCFDERVAKLDAENRGKNE